MKTLISFITAFGIALVSAMDVSANSCKASNKTTPDGFDSMLVYLGTGLVDLTTDPVDGPKMCAGGVCDGTWFHFDIMGRPG